MNDAGNLAGARGSRTSDSAQVVPPLALCDVMDGWHAATDLGYLCEGLGLGLASFDLASSWIRDKRRRLERTPTAQGRGRYGWVSSAQVLDRPIDERVTELESRLQKIEAERRAQMLRLDDELGAVRREVADLPAKVGEMLDEGFRRDRVRTYPRAALGLGLACLGLVLQFIGSLAA